MSSFVKICMSDLFKSLVTISALIWVASWKDFAFIRLLDSPWANYSDILFLLSLLLFVHFHNIFECFVRLTCWLAVIWIVGNKKVFIIVQQSVTKADQLCFVWTENFVIQLRYVFINLALAENGGGLSVQVGFVLLVGNFLSLLDLEGAQYS